MLCVIMAVFMGFQQGPNVHPVSQSLFNQLVCLAGEQFATEAIDCIVFPGVDEPALHNFFLIYQCPVCMVIMKMSTILPSGKGECLVNMKQPSAYNICPVFI